jgi:hypothetical protein
MTGQVGGGIIIVGKQFDNGSYDGRTEGVARTPGRAGSCGALRPQADPSGIAGTHNRGRGLSYLCVGSLFCCN